MKSVWVTMPLPRCMDRWEKLVAKYNLEEPVYHTSICHKVQLPPGWVVLPAPDDLADHWVMYDEYREKVALIYLTKKLGFTTLEPSYKKKDAGRKDQYGL